MSGLSPALEKALVAERVGAPVRVAVVVFGALVYLLLVDRADHVRWLAWSLIVLATLYSVAIPLARPYEKRPTLATSWTVTVLDAVFILAFVYATGGVSSPYFLLMYVSITGVAFRFSYRRTMVASVLYAAAYLGLVVALGGLPTYAAEAVLRAGMVVLVAAEAGLLSREATRWAEEKLEGVARLREASARLREQEAVKTRLLNHVAHELRTPLTPMKVQLHLLRMQSQDLPPYQEKALAVLERNLDQVERLTQDALDTTRIEAGQVTLERTECDVAQLAREAWESFEPAAARAGLTLRLHAEGPLPVHGDPRRIMQVLSNLLTNAIKFTDAGGHVDLVARRDDHHTVVEVRDEGRGLSEDDIERLFQPFSQVGDEAQRAVGTGLGLHISKGLVEAHGGTIWAASDGAGRGSRFGFTLPLLADQLW